MDNYSDFDWPQLSYRKFPVQCHFHFGNEMRRRLIAEKERHRIS